MDHLDLVPTDDELDPLEAVEHVLIAEQKTFERADDEVHFAATTDWTDLHGVPGPRPDPGGRHEDAEGQTRRCRGASGAAE
jgi:hypothetical protein